MFNILNTQNVTSAVADKWQWVKSKNLCHFNVTEVGAGYNLRNFHSIYTDIVTAIYYGTHTKMTKEPETFPMAYLGNS